MVIRTKVRVTEIPRGLGEHEQIVERALLACERDQRKMDAELHLPAWRDSREWQPSERLPAHSCSQQRSSSPLTPPSLSGAGPRRCSGTQRGGGIVDRATEVLQK